MRQPVLLITIVCLVVTFCLFLWFFVRRRTMDAALRRDLRLLRELSNEFSDRLRHIEAHAADYMNTLGSEGGRELFELRRLVLTLEKIVLEAESMIVTGEWECILAARQFLESSLRGVADDSPEDDDLSLIAGGLLSTTTVLPVDWDRRIEELIQTVGNRVADASVMAEESGIPKRRKRRPTLLSLAQAKIRPAGPYRW